MQVLNMEPITDDQIAQGIAPGNNWLVDWVIVTLYIADDGRGISRLTAMSSTQKDPILSLQMLSGLA